MDYDIRFKDDTAHIVFGKRDIAGKYKQSPNGELFIVCDTLYTESENAEDAEYIFVFTHDTVVYKKAMPDDASAEWFAVFDDGSSLIVTDEYILSLLPDGKQAVRKKFSGLEFCRLERQTLYVVGCNDDDKKVLMLFDVSSRSIVQRIIPDIEYDEPEDDDAEDCERPDPQYSCETELYFTGERFVFIYRNRSDAVAFDLRGDPVDPKPAEIETANAIRKERERKHAIERAMTQYGYWSKRLSKSIMIGNAADVEKSQAAVEKYKGRLIELGVSVPEDAPHPAPKTAPASAAPRVSNAEAVPTANKKLPTWAIILIVAAVILAIIGKVT